MIRTTFAGFSTALSALQENQKQLDVIGHNISNMNTEGYTRQALKTSSVNYENPISFYMNTNDVNVGYGVSIDAVNQLRDQFLDIQYRDQNTNTQYNSRTADALESISTYMDETDHDGLKSAFTKLRNSLINMQDVSKVSDPVYESQTRSDAQAVATLFNSAASSIATSKTNEFQKITGEGSSENGDVERINTILRNIGDLNVTIKNNQMLGNPALELQDQRNSLLDELSGYIPIQVTYYTEKYKTSDGEIRDRGLNYDSYGNVTGKSDYPDDVQVDLVYSTTQYDSDGNPTTTQNRITLVNGSDIRDENGKHVNNYGSVSMAYPNTSSSSYEGYEGSGRVDVKFTQAASYTANTGSGRDSNLNLTDSANAGTATENGLSVVTTDSLMSESDKTVVRLGTANSSGAGSLQASLDLLSDTYTSEHNGTLYRSFDYYNDRLDTLAQSFALMMDKYNYLGANEGAYASETDTLDSLSGDDLAAALSKKSDNFLLLVNRNNQSAEGITAANISVSRNWASGTTTIGKNADPNGQGNSTDTVMHMLRSMYNTHSDINNNTYTSETSAIETYLANDKYNNNVALETNTTVRDGISNSKDQVSGVSLDEEAANMMTYVSSYNAAAKLMTTIDETIQTLLAVKS